MTGLCTWLVRSLHLFLLIPLPSPLIPSITQCLFGSPFLPKLPCLAQWILSLAKTVSISLFPPLAQSLSSLGLFRSYLLSPFPLPQCGMCLKPPFVLIHPTSISPSTSLMELKFTVSIISKVALSLLLKWLASLFSPHWQEAQRST